MSPLPLSVWRGTILRRRPMSIDHPGEGIVGDVPGFSDVPVQQIFAGYDAAEAPASLPAFCVACGTPLVWDPAITYSRCPNCQRRTFRNPYPGVAILVVREGRVLLGRRR